MKKSKILCILVCILVSIFTLSSCDAAMNGGGAYAPEGDYGGGYGSSADGDLSTGKDYGESLEPDMGEDGGEVDTDVEEVKPDEVIRPAGLITASAWCDNDNYAFYLENFEQSDNGGGKFASYAGSFGLNSLVRKKITVTSSGNAVAGAKVVGKNESGEVVFSAVTDATGVAYLFGTKIASVSVTSGDFSESASTLDADEVAVELSGAEGKRDIIDIMFVIDATGSMGDELFYLQNEISDVIGRIASANSDAIVNLAIMFYRDEVDSEEFCYFDFVDVTSESGLATQKAALESRSAQGGGDYPEQLDEALLMAADKQWSSGASTKLIFLVLDAPCHNDEEDKKNFSDAVNLAAERGIRICPILCSGADTFTEYLSREAAIQTGGTFVFVTDDSGIGGSHHDPSIPNAQVEALNDLMVRLVNGYHSGAFAPAVNWRDTAKSEN